ncbi:MAG TPA: hypothetical protein VLX68_08165 [Chitinivibrionales bacterium]|nr:hypothetical protein [Chitinivibrionales bacterium]
MAFPHNKGWVTRSSLYYGVGRPSGLGPALGLPREAADAAAKFKPVN